MSYEDRTKIGQGVSLFYVSALTQEFLCFYVSLESNVQNLKNIYFVFLIHFLDMIENSTDLNRKLAHVIIIVVCLLGSVWRSVKIIHQI